MTFEDFDKLTDELISEIKKMRDTKGKEYANNDADRLANFKEIAADMRTKLGANVRAIDVWYIYCFKHIRAIESFIKNGIELSDETIRGRFVDTLTYLILGYALLVDERPKVHTKYIKGILPNLNEILAIFCYTCGQPTQAAALFNNQHYCPVCFASVQQ